MPDLVTGVKSEQKGSEYLFRSSCRAEGGLRGEAAGTSGSERQSAHQISVLLDCFSAIRFRNSLNVPLCWRGFFDNKKQY